MIPWPQEDTKFEDWARSLKLLQPQIDILPLDPQEVTWKIWANQVVQSTFCQTVSAPRSDSFKEWKEWAYAFIRAFGTAAFNP